MARLYTTQPGDTWDSIAAANGLATTRLWQWNFPGVGAPPPLPSKITIPDPPSPPATTRSNGTTYATYVCTSGGDLALDNTTAQLFSPAAPLTQIPTTAKIGSDAQ